MIRWETLAAARQVRHFNSHQSIAAIIQVTFRMFHRGELHHGANRFLPKVSLKNPFYGLSWSWSKILGQKFDSHYCSWCCMIAIGSCCLKCPVYSWNPDNACLQRLRSDVKIHGTIRLSTSPKHWNRKGHLLRTSMQLPEGLNHRTQIVPVETMVCLKSFLPGLVVQVTPRAYRHGRVKKNQYSIIFYM